MNPIKLTLGVIVFIALTTIVSWFITSDYIEPKPYEKESYILK